MRGRDQVAPRDQARPAEELAAAVEPRQPRELVGGGDVAADDARAPRGAAALWGWRERERDEICLKIFSGQVFFVFFVLFRFFVF